MEQTKTEMWGDVIRAYVLGRGDEVRHREIRDMIRVVAPAEADHYGWYIHHLLITNKLTRVRRGVFRASIGASK